MRCFDYLWGELPSSDPDEEISSDLKIHSRFVYKFPVTGLINPATRHKNPLYGSKA
jgi:hypothetical protein